MILQLLGKAYHPSLQFLGMETLVRLRQPVKAQSSMEVTLSGMVMLVRLAQPLKVSTPMEVTPLRMVTLVRLAQP